MLGAEVRLPSLTLESRSIDGLYFFRADGSAPVLQIDAAGVPLLGAGLPYLSYDPLLNLFYGLTDALEATEGASQLIDALLDGLAADPALLGIRFEPDLDFALASQGFTADASSAASNVIGLRLLNPVPEPASGWLVLVALVLAWGAVKPGRLGPALPPRAPCGPGSPGR